jgi:hypothetical protein
VKSTVRPAEIEFVELTMALAVVATPPTGIAALSRAVVSTAADFVQTIEKAMVGEAKIRTAQRNAWDALCEDRARAQARAEMDAIVRAILAADFPQPDLAQPDLARPDLEKPDLHRPDQVRTSGDVRPAVLPAPAEVRTPADVPARASARRSRGRSRRLATNAAGH